jgi:hypothetical protein
MASTSSDGHGSVRRTRSANDVAIARQSANSAGGGPSGRTSTAAALDGGSFHPLASPTGLEGVTSTTSILPTSTSAEDATVSSTLKASGSNLNSNANLMEGSSATVTNNAPLVPPSPAAPATPPTPRPQTQGNDNANNGTLVQRLFGFLGYGNNATQSRKTQVQVVQHIVWGFSQVGYRSFFCG